MGEAQKDTGPHLHKQDLGRTIRGQAQGKKKRRERGAHRARHGTGHGFDSEFLFGDPFALWVRAVQRRNSFGVPVLVLVRASSFRACELCCVREFFGKFLFRAPVPCLVL